MNTSGEKEGGNCEKGRKERQVRVGEMHRERTGQICRKEGAGAGGGGFFLLHFFPYSLVCSAVKEAFHLVRRNLVRQRLKNDSNSLPSFGRVC